MTEKSIKFSFTVDDRSVQHAKHALTEILSLTERIARSMSGGAGGPGGQGPPMTFLGGMNVGGRPGGGGPAKAPGAAGAANNPYAAQAKGLRDLSKTSGDTAKTMAQDLRKSIEDQKRSLSDLDAALETASKRYEELMKNQSSLVSSMLAQGATPAQAQAYSSGQLQGQRDYIDNTRAKRFDVAGELRNAQEAHEKHRAKVAGGGWESELGEGGTPQAPKAKSWVPNGAKVAATFVALSAAGSAVADAMFKGVSAPLQRQAREAQLFGTMGVQTLQGDLTNAVAAMRLTGGSRAGGDNYDTTRFMELSQMVKTQQAASAGAAVSALVGLDVNGATKAAAAVAMPSTELKERMARMLEDHKLAEPLYYANLNNFQNSAATRVAMSRRTGYSPDGLHPLLAKYDPGEALGGFEAMRGGGYGFAQKNLWVGASLSRQGLNVNDIGQMLSASAASLQGKGAVAEMLRTIRVGLDPVAVEQLAKGVAAGVQAGLFGATSGMGLAETLRFGMEGMSGAEQTRAMGARVSGLAGASVALGGGDGLGKAINVLAANKIVGPNGDIFTKQALLELAQDPMSLAAAARGDISGPMAAAGITQKMAQQMQATTGTRAMAQYTPQPGVDLNPGSKRYRTLVEKYGGNYKAMFDDLPISERALLPGTAMTELSSAVQQQKLPGISTFDQAQAYVALAAGIGGGPVGPGSPQGGDPTGKTTEGIFVNRTRETAENALRDFLTPEVKKTIEDAASAAPVLAATFLNMGNVSVSAGEAADSLKRLTDTIDIFVKRYGVPRDRAEFEEKEAKRKAAREAQDVQNTAEAKDDPISGDNGWGKGLPNGGKAPKFTVPGGGQK